MHIINEIVYFVYYMGNYIVSESNFKFSIPEKIVHYRYVLIKMEENPLFNSSASRLIHMSKFVDILEKFNIILEEKSQREKILFWEKKTDELFKEQAEYINNLAKGDIKIIIRSGFHPILTD